jgi:hypothetical protein
MLQSERKATVSQEEPDAINIKSLQMLAVSHDLPKLPLYKPESKLEEEPLAKLMRAAEMRLFTDAGDLVRHLNGGTRWVARQLMDSAEQLLLSQDNDRAAAYAQLGAAAAAAANDMRVHCRSIILWAHARWAQGDWHEAKHCWQRALESLGPGHAQERALCHQNLAACALIVGDWATAKRHIERFLIIGSGPPVESLREHMIIRLIECYAQTNDQTGPVLAALALNRFSVQKAAAGLAATGAVELVARLHYLGYPELAERLRRAWTKRWRD